MSLENIIADLRETGMKDSQIAETVGCSVSAVSMWGSGNRAVKNGEYMLKLFRLHEARCGKSRKQKQAA